MTALTSLRELASRSSGGLTVSLYWHPEDDQALVHVSDELTGERFILEPPRADALDAYYHPYSLVQEGVSQQA
jgi:hypothetical protein